MIYSTYFKLNAIKLYLTEKKSYREIGELAFSKTRGRPKKGEELTKSLFNKQSDSSDFKQELVKLQNENLNLRMST